MKILVIGGLHGNELLGIKLVKMLEANPIESVDTIIGNPKAVRNNSRFMETDLNRSFGVVGLDGYEAVRSNEILNAVRKYDYVFDFHNTQTPENNCCFFGPDTNSALHEAVNKMNIKNGIIATYDCINKAATNVVSIEISIGDSLDNPRYWYEWLNLFIHNSLESVADLSMYSFSRRVTWSEASSIESTKKWKPFVKLNANECREFGVEADSVPIFIGSRLTNFYATLLQPVKKTNKLAK